MRRKPVPRSRTIAPPAVADVPAEEQLEMRRHRLERLAERFEEAGRRLDELEARLQQAEEDFRPRQPR